MKPKAVLIIAFILLLAAAGMGFAYYLGTQDKKLANLPNPSPMAMATPTAQPEATEVEPTTVDEPETDIPAGWLTYQNEEYGFAISYPESYEALDDPDNLYGWPNGIVLFYGGGQSYDLPIEIWDDPSEYEAKYPTPMDNLTVKKVGNKYLTLFNMNKETEVDQIIATFRFMTFSPD